MSFFNSDYFFKGQRYATLRKQCISTGQLFRDPEFPPTEKSIFNSGQNSDGIEWKRPRDICADPKLVVDGISSRDLIQGELGNCWFVAACCCLAINKTVWSQVIPDLSDQEWDSNVPEKYTGLFHFRFWRFDVWTDVVVDDLLPTRNGQLIFVHSNSRNEFWSALLEKAYAKLYGCYEALDGGELSEALEDFTGGVSETYDLAEEKYAENGVKKEDFFNWLKNQIADHALMAAAIPAKSKDDMEKPTKMGLVMGHAYSVTAVRRVTMKGTGLFNLFNREKIQMIRLRNPWGGSEWNGAFSDGSEEWTTISTKDRQKIGLTFEEDGEFWMTFDDYCSYFVNMAICHVINLSTFSFNKRWTESVLHDEWAIPHRCGGCVNNKETFLNNPQFIFDMTKDEEVIVVLTQKTNKHLGEDNITIGFTLMKVEENRLYRVHTPQPIVASSAFRNSRSVFMRRLLVRGRYVVIASTFSPGSCGQFLLRFYNGCDSEATALNLDKPAKKSCPCMAMNRYPECVTRIVVIKGIDLVKKDSDPKDSNPYCIISCEGEKIQSPVEKKNPNPEWNTSAMFYRKSPMENPITIEVWHSGIFMDDFVGRLTIPAVQIVTDQIQDQPLLDRKLDEPNKSGRLVVHISTSYNLQSF